jgi:hypothetical protein
VIALILLLIIGNYKIIFCEQNGAVFLPGVIGVILVIDI